MKNASRSQKFVWTLLTTAVAGGVFLTEVSTVSAGNYEQAKRIYDRLAGVPPSSEAGNPKLQQMVTALIAAEANPTAATKRALAEIAMADPNFLNVTVKNMVVPWTNRDMTVFYPFNDAAATLVGIIRDDLDFRKALTDDIIYVGVGVGNYSNSNNTMYENLEASNADLSKTSVLAQVSQSGTTGISTSGIAGVLTTRQSARAFFYAGTNRRMLRFAFLNYMCKDLENIKDTSRYPDRVRQDVSRSPGGDSSVYLNTCLGCHAGMDGLAGAFAYHQWNFNEDTDPEGNNGNMIYTAGVVQPKNLINSTVFQYGYVTKDDSWINRWRTGPNANLGWANNSQQAETTGNGIQSFAKEIAYSEEFARCQAIKVYKTVCFNEPDESKLGSLVTDFKLSYSMKQLFANAAFDCRGN